MKELKRVLGWDIMDDTLAIEVEDTVDPRIVSVTITFNAIKHELDDKN